MIPCLACAKVPEPVFPREPELSQGLTAQPYGATTFTSYGQYGSTVFDEMGRQYLYIVICDDCMKAASERHVIALCTALPPVQPPVREELWIFKECEEEPE